METMAKLIILFLLFAPIIYKACRYEKWYLYIICAFYTILPDALAIEVSSSLPLITFKRLMIFILCIVWIYNYKCRKRERIPRELCIYIIVNILVSIVNLRIGFGEVNNIFIIVFEQFILVMAIKSTISSKDELYKCVDFLIYGSVALAVISILQTVLKIDVTTSLMIVESRVTENISNRMNTVRAFGTTNAISNACYCSFMMLITLFMYEKRKRFSYIVFFGINAVALLCTMTRSALLAFCIVIAIMCFIRNIRFIKIYIKYIVLAIIAVTAILVIKPSLFDSVIEVFKSILNVLGIEVELSEQFGMNASNASYSRLVQWTAVYYMAQEGLMWFGYGYRAFLRGCLYYFFNQFGRWTKATALDTGFVAIAVERGVIGLISNWALWLSMAYSAFVNRDKTSYDFYKLTLYVTILYVIINVASAFANAELVWLYIALFFSYRELDYSEKYEEQLKERNE